MEKESITNCLFHTLFPAVQAAISCTLAEGFKVHTHWFQMPGGSQALGEGAPAHELFAWTLAGGLQRGVTEAPSSYTVPFVCDN